MKRPAFQFYPADWRKDTALQSCSLAARGLWHEMICLMHECEPYGFMSVNGKPMKAAQIARLVGVTDREYAKLLSELEDAGVYSLDDEGCIFSRRMVKDEHLRNVRAEAGKKGGNPTLVGNKDKGLDKQKVNQIDNQSPTPSSSSSSSPSGQKEKEIKETASPSAPPAKPKSNGSRLPDNFQVPDDWMDWASSERKDIPIAELPVIAAGFVDYWAAKAGAAARKVSWEATWRNWIRNHRQSAGPPASRHQKYDPKSAWTKINQGLSNDNTIDINPSLAYQE